MVRSISTKWQKGSVLVVDGGSHLSSLIKIFEEHLPRAERRKRKSDLSINSDLPRKARPPSINNGSLPDASPLPPNEASYFPPITEAKNVRSNSPAPVDHSGTELVLTSGPFQGLALRYESAKANAAYLLRNLISSYLITHPHLDHIAGFVINTASFTHTSRPKKLIALPSVIDAIKTHVFNDVIWPNMSDEEGGVGFVSYSRLVEGGNLALGDGDSRGYIEVVEDLAVKCWSVSHGTCTKPHSHRGSQTHHSQESPVYPSSRRASYANASPSGLRSHRYSQSLGDGPLSSNNEKCVVDSSAFFIRDDESGQEILIFGDVEPDSISLYPRTFRVWNDAAPKIASGLLKGIFIECSFEDSQRDETLFGHLAPRHLIAELQSLAEKVQAVKNNNTDDGRKRKRQSNGMRISDETGTDREGRTSRRGRPSFRTRPAMKSKGSSISPTGRHSVIENTSPLTQNISSSHQPLIIPSPNIAALTTPSPTVSMSASATLAEPFSKATLIEEVGGIPMSPDTSNHSFYNTQTNDVSMKSVGSAGTGIRPLDGLPVIIIHVKETLKDGPPVQEIILKQLEMHEERAQTGVKFMLCQRGGSFYL